jgi:rRNA maturation protein Nop10
VQVKCPKCGAENWLENQSRCLACDAILRRCADCASYSAASERCTKFGTEVERREAESPSVLSSSTNCLGYQCVQ